jgi:hypothetical protein
MLYNMPISQSGRLLVEVEPDEKEELYEALQSDGLTLKSWFQHYRRLYLLTREQPSLFEQSPLPQPTTKKKRGAKQ